MAQLITTAQNLTSGWVDLGSPINTTGYYRLGLYLNIDINDSLNVRVRANAMRHQGDTSDYNLPILTISSSDVKAEAEYIEFNVDADQNMLIEVPLNEVVPYVQIQVQAGTVGVSAGQIDEADYILSRN